MTRATDPLAIPPRQWRPRTHVQQPMRHQDRRQIYGPRIQPSDDLVNIGRRIPSGRIAMVIAVVAVLVFGWNEVRAIAASGTVAGRERSQLHVSALTGDHRLSQGSGK